MANVRSGEEKSHINYRIDPRNVNIYEHSTFSKQKINNNRLVAFYELPFSFIFTIAGEMTQLRIDTIAKYLNLTNLTLKSEPNVKQSCKKEDVSNMKQCFKKSKINGVENVMLQTIRNIYYIFIK